MSPPGCTEAIGDQWIANDDCSNAIRQFEKLGLIEHDDQVSGAGVLRSKQKDTAGESQPTDCTKSNKLTQRQGHEYSPRLTHRPLSRGRSGRMGGSDEEFTRKW
jgi:hypothetical protein